MQTGNLLLRLESESSGTVDGFLVLATPLLFRGQTSDSELRQLSQNSHELGIDICFSSTAYSLKYLLDLLCVYWAKRMSMEGFAAMPLPARVAEAKCITAFASKCPGAVGIKFRAERSAKKLLMKLNHCFFEKHIGLVDPRVLQSAAGRRKSYQDHITYGELHEQIVKLDAYATWLAEHASLFKKSRTVQTVDPAMIVSLKLGHKAIEEPPIDLAKATPAREEDGGQSSAKSAAVSASRPLRSAALTARARSLAVINGIPLDLVVVPRPPSVLSLADSHPSPSPTNGEDGVPPALSGNAVGASELPVRQAAPLAPRSQPQSAIPNELVCIGVKCPLKSCPYVGKTFVAMSRHHKMAHHMRAPAESVQQLVTAQLSRHGELVWVTKASLRKNQERWKEVEKMMAIEIRAEASKEKQRIIRRKQLERKESNRIAALSAKTGQRSVGTPGNRKTHPEEEKKKQGEDDPELHPGEDSDVQSIGWSSEEEEEEVPKWGTPGSELHQRFSVYLAKKEDSYAGQLAPADAIDLPSFGIASSEEVRNNARLWTRPHQSLAAFFHELRDGLLSCPASLLSSMHPYLSSHSHLPSKTRNASTEAVGEQLFAFAARKQRASPEKLPGIRLLHEMMPLRREHVRDLASVYVSVLKQFGAEPDTSVLLEFIQCTVLSESKAPLRTPVRSCVTRGLVASVCWSLLGVFCLCIPAIAADTCPQLPSWMKDALNQLRAMPSACTHDVMLPLELDHSEFSDQEHRERSERPRNQAHELYAYGNSNGHSYGHLNGHWHERPASNDDSVLFSAIGARRGSALQSSERSPFGEEHNRIENRLSSPPPRAIWYPETSILQADDAGQPWTVSDAISQRARLFSPEPPASLLGKRSWSDTSVSFAEHNKLESRLLPN